MHNIRTLDRKMSRLLRHGQRRIVDPGVEEPLALTSSSSQSVSCNSEWSKQQAQETHSMTLANTLIASHVQVGTGDQQSTELYATNGVEGLDLPSWHA